MNPLRCATLVVADVRTASRRYSLCFDYTLVAEGVVDVELAASWGAPASAGRPWALMRPLSGRAVDLRLVEGEPHPAYSPLRSVGWAAVELCVRDVATLHERLRGGPFEIWGAPSTIASLPSIHPMQVCGPDGDVVYLTQVLQGGPGQGLPLADADVDQFFIAVLGCADMPASAAWFARQLAVPLSPVIEMPYRMLARAFELPPQQLHRLVIATSDDPDRDIFLEFDQLPPSAELRLRHAGHLPPGFAICTLMHPALDAVPGPWLSPPLSRAGPLYAGRRVGVLQAPEGALLELMETAA